MKFWHRLSTRERVMFGATLALVAGLLIYATVVPAWNYLNTLDEDIADLEWQLIQNTELALRSEAVDQAYARIAAVHGSDLTREEIHDGLRDEIYRLVQRELVPPGQELPGGGDPRQRIVLFNELPEGQLREGLEGYREYSIAFQTLQGQLTDLMEFLRRVQESPQALRIQKLDFVRAPNVFGLVTADIEVARTVVDGVPEEITAMLDAQEGNLIANGGFEEWSEEAGFPGWTAVGAELVRTPQWRTEGEQAAAVTTNGGDASLYQETELKPGASYALEFDLAANADANVGVEIGGAVIGEQGVRADGQLYSYRMEFTVPDGGAAAAKAPLIRAAGAGTALYIDNVVLRRIGG